MGKELLTTILSSTSAETIFRVDKECGFETILEQDTYKHWPLNHM